MERLLRDLEGVCGARQVSTREPDLETYSRDMWPRLLLAVRDGAASEHRPHVVVWPETTRDVAAIVRIARAHAVPIVPYGGGSGVCGGVVPLRGGITVDLKRMDSLEGVRGDDMICDVQAGMNGERFERELNRRGYTLGHFPSSIYCSTVGGWIATRAAGQLSNKYGKIEDRVAGLTVVTGRGEVIVTDALARATRGPSVTQLMVGSEGTLGIVTQARLRLATAPVLRVFRAYEFADLSSGMHAIRRVMQRGLRPAVVRLYDEVDTFINALGGKHEDSRPPTHDHAPIPAARSSALPTLPGTEADDEDSSVFARLGAVFRGDTRKSALRQEALGALLGRPKLFNAVAGGIVDKFSTKGCKLIVGLEGPRIRTEVEAGLVMRELEDAGGRDLGDGPGLHWLAHRYSISYRMAPMFRDGAFVDTMEVASTWQRLPDLYDAVKRAISAHALVMAHLSHAYTDGCSIYFSFAGQGADRRDAERIYDAIWRDGLSAAARVGGTISHHHGIGMLKGPFMRAEHREAMHILNAIKKTFDPDGIMNPGKLGMAMGQTP